MKWTALLVVLTCLFLPSLTHAQPSDDRQGATDLLRNAIRAMGGEEALRGIHSLQFSATQERNALEQSEWPEGPYIAEIDQIREWRDFAGRRWKQAVNAQFAWLKNSINTVVTDGAAVRFVGGHAVPGGCQDMQARDEALELSPERILLTAVGSGDAHRLPEVSLHVAPQDVIAFTWRRSVVKLFLSRTTHLPSAMEWNQAYPCDTFWSVWGDVTTRVEYSLWWLAGSGIHYPLQMDIVRNGLPDRKITITDLKLNESLSDSLFQIPAQAKAAFLAHPPATVEERTLAVEKAQELAPGIVFFPGAWNTTLVKQEDGIVVLEAPISSGYSGRVIAEAQRRYPGAPVKAVISTSDSWPHVGGIREYVARGVPVYVLDRTLPLLHRLVAAPRTRLPDALAHAPRTPRFVPVNGKTVIGSGPNRIELYPINGQTTERQMMAYFPGHKLLYGSDAFQRFDNQYFYPQTISEVRDAVAREHLNVVTFFMMHMEPTPWRELLKVHGGPIPQS
jgi:hypothetical protein